MRADLLLTTAVLGSVGSAYKLPANLKAIYDQHKVRLCFVLTLFGSDYDLTQRTVRYLLQQVVGDL
jgi:hypothetical protein